MKNILILFLFLNLLLFSFSIVHNWNLENSSIDLLENIESKTLSILSYSGEGYGMKVELYKYITIENGSVFYMKILDVYNISSSTTKIFERAVTYDDIDSFFYLNNNYIICPKGKYHPLLVDSNGDFSELNVGNGWEENGEWELKCYHHYSGYFLVFYLMNGNCQFFRTKTSGSFSWERQDLHNEIYDFKLNNE